MDISSFDGLLQAARMQPEPQRLLFVFAAVELPDDATPAQRARFEAGQGAEVVAIDDLARHAAELDGEAQPRREGEVEAGAGEGLVDAAELALREVEVGPVGLVEHDLGELQVAGLVVALEVHCLEGGGGGDGRGAGQAGQVDAVVAGQALVPLF